MKRATLGTIGAFAAIVATSSLGACVNFDGYRFCEPGCPGSGGSGGATSSTSSSGGEGGSGGNTTSSTGGSTSSSGGGGGCGGKAKTPESDPFDGSGKPDSVWKPLDANRSAPAMSQSNGELVIAPTANATWMTDQPKCAAGGCGAPSIVQRLHGNFAIKTHARVDLTTGKTADFSAAGIFVALPCDEANNNVLWDIGYQNALPSTGTDLYRVVDGQPKGPIVTKSSGAEADLYLCRVDDQFFAYVSDQGSVPAPDLPAQTFSWTSDDVEVGISAHANNEAVIKASFSEANFWSPKTQLDCTKGQ